MPSFTQVSTNNPVCELFLCTSQMPPHISPSHSITQSHSVSSTDHAAPHYAVSCSLLFPSSSQPQIPPSALYSQTLSVYVPPSVEGNKLYADIATGKVIFLFILILYIFDNKMEKYILEKWR